MELLHQLEAVYWGRAKPSEQQSQRGLLQKLFPRAEIARLNNKDELSRMAVEKEMAPFLNTDPHLRFQWRTSTAL